MSPFVRGLPQILCLCSYGFYKTNYYVHTLYTVFVSSVSADRQDEKEIKKTLHEHSMCPRRASQMPMRAHHSIHAEAAGKDPRIMRPTGRTILVKKHNKQMWRPPTVSPEGGETQRPFSPFGGTLPPSKICSKKKVVEVFV